VVHEPQQTEETTMAGKFCVTLTHCRSDNDKVTVAFVVANAAIGCDKETMIFASSDGVWAAIKGEADKINVGAPFSPLKDLVDKFVASGGQILVCTPCLTKRGLTEEDLIDGARAAGGAALVEWLSESPACVGY
jgi:predicted peroxiredoxin